MATLIEPLEIKKRKLNPIYEETFQALDVSDILLHLFSFLSIRERLKCSSVCKSWRDIIYTSSFPRSKLYLYNLPHDAKLFEPVEAPSVTSSPSLFGDSFAKLYKPPPPSFSINTLMWKKLTKAPYGENLQEINFGKCKFPTDIEEFLSALPYNLVKLKTSELVLADDTLVILFTTCPKLRKLKAKGVIGNVTADGLNYITETHAELEIFEITTRAEMDLIQMEPFFKKFGSKLKSISFSTMFNGSVNYLTLVERHCPLLERLECYRPALPLLRMISNKCPRLKALQISRFDYFSEQALKAPVFQNLKTLVLHCYTIPTTTKWLRVLSQSKVKLKKLAMTGTDDLKPFHSIGASLKYLKIENRLVDPAIFIMCPKLEAASIYASADSLPYLAAHQCLKRVEFDLAVPTVTDISECCALLEEFLQYHRSKLFKFNADHPRLEIRQLVRKYCPEFESSLRRRLD